MITVLLKCKVKILFVVKLYNRIWNEYYQKESVSKSTGPHIFKGKKLLDLAHKNFSHPGYCKRMNNISPH